MSDIVKRLRQRSVEDRCVIADAGLMQDAASEIERLRRAVDKMADAAGPACTPHWVLNAPWRTSP